ncbi:unnamed protein product [Cochlearia groenlandica]
MTPPVHHLDPNSSPLPHPRELTVVGSAKVLEPCTMPQLMLSPPPSSPSEFAQSRETICHFYPSKYTMLSTNMRVPYVMVPSITKTRNESLLPHFQ